MLHIISLRAQISQIVKYWYEKCDVLVQILHALWRIGTNSSQCEICGSTKLLTEHHVVFLSLRRGCTGSSESTHVKMPHCWKSHVTAHFTNKCVPISKALDTLIKCIADTGEVLYTCVSPSGFRPHVQAAILWTNSFKIVSEYDKEIPQSQTADKTTALRGRATQQSRDTGKTD